MVGSQAGETDWENLTNKQLHDKFQQMMSGQVQDVLNRFDEAMEKIDGIEKTSKQSLIASLMNCSRVFHHHRRLHLSHLCNNNNNASFRINMDERSVFLLRMAKLLVLLYLLLMLLWLLVLLLLVPRRMMSMRAIMRMRLIKIRTTCNHQHHQNQVVLRYIIATVGLHHHLRYEIMTCFLN